MKDKNLVIVAHLKHYVKRGNFYSYEPYVRELAYWAVLFESITIYAEISTKREAFAIAQLPDNIFVQDIGFRSGPGFLNNLIRVVQIPRLFLKMFKVYRHAELIHTRSSGIPTMAINLYNLIWNKPTIEKWATNAPPDKALGLLTGWNYRLLNYSPSNTRVFVYAPVENERFILSFPALFSNQELDQYRSYVGKSKWLDPSREFVCVSRLHKDKNVGLLLDAVKLGIANKELDKDFKVSIVGGGPQEESILKFVIDNGLSDNIHVLGKLPFNSTLKIMAKSHYLIMPGINEGWGKVINEALSVDCIPLVVKGGNAERVMRRMEHPGLLFSNSPSSLVSTIKEAIDTPRERVDSWLKSGSYHNRLLTLESYIKKVEKTYDEITGLRH